MRDWIAKYRDDDESCVTLQGTTFMDIKKQAQKMFQNKADAEYEKAVAKQEEGITYRRLTVRLEDIAVRFKTSMDP